MNLPHDLENKLDGIARRFQSIAKNESSGAYKAIMKEAVKIAEKADCDKVWDDRSPNIHYEEVYNIHESEWINILRRLDNAFAQLCEEFLDTIANDPRAEMDADDAFVMLDEALTDNFWLKIFDRNGSIHGSEFEHVYDNVRRECAEGEELDPYAGTDWGSRYAYYGVSRSDSMASSRTLTTSDRSSLIRFASSLPKGDAMRRAVLAGLTRR